ncbi:alpha/beta hydrolase-fold protein [Cohnella algarum]|uniref:alpha/beta hydrolase-fold protein n=1 Tax=Cohnella algarum TaxID=2044859 RepID=UPI0019685E7E|nr:alpha/beta hydrolase-fold protein [Cohnella algarum]MBN2982101.1 esterase [Cohnella algarum]
MQPQSQAKRLSQSQIRTFANFRSEFLDNERELFVYLPPGYDAPGNEGERYPALYMHDGQHAFRADDRGGSWEARETADRLIAEGKIRPLIIVAVANVASARIAEYMHPVPGLGEVYGAAGRGDLYERFLIEEVKPFIDREFRTLPGPEDTGVLGSSAGGLVSYNLGFRRPDVFGLVGALCPFFVKPDPTQETEQWLTRIYRHKPPIRLWIDVGDAEGFTVMDKHVRTVVKAMLDAGFATGRDLAYHFVPGSGHSQKDWAARLHAPLLFLFGRVGNVADSLLLGPDKVGLNGAAAVFHPIDIYDTGFVATNLAASFRVADPSVLSVLQDGTVVPHREGATEVAYTNAAGRTSVRAVTVVRELAERVKVTLRVVVPPDTPDEETIYAGIELPRIGPYAYGGTYMLPRDFAVEFRISRGMGRDEADESGRPAPFRLLRAQENLVAEYRVAGWIDRVRV